MLRKFWLPTLVVVALAIPMVADAPLRIPLSFTSGPFVIGSCGSFDIVQTGSVTGLQLVWFDANGQPIRAVTQLQTQITFTNSETGQSVSGFSNVEQNLDVTGQTVSQQGLAVSIDLPKRGKLNVEAGRISFNFGTGEVTFVTPGFANKDILGQLCSALE